ncbi:hypothetical protein AB0L06_43225 [Spirillospora sp. NPDC052269]
MGRERGQSGRSLELLMVQADVEAFSAAIAPDIRGQAMWTDHLTAASEHLTEVLSIDGIQAHLQLLDGSGNQAGPLIQFLNTHRGPYSGAEVLADGRYVPVKGRETLDCGRLAHVWFPGEQPPEVRERFTALIALTYRHIRAGRYPHVSFRDGRQWRKCRIGAHAEQWLREDPQRGIRHGGVFLELTKP